MKNFELSDDFFKYIENNSSVDVSRLRLQAHGKESEFPYELAITQIEARSKAARKLSRFMANRHFLFPSTLAAEQSTHQAVALYHASLIGTGKKVADLTAGLGIDAFTISEAGNDVTTIELDQLRAEILDYNKTVLGRFSKHISQMQTVQADCLEWLSAAKNRSTTLDFIFIDPARRTADNRRTYFLSDCVPDVVANFGKLAAAAETVMIKASPIMDITGIMRELPATREIHIVCVNNECKEVLIVADGKRSQNNSDECRIKVVNLKDSDKLEFISEFDVNYSDLNGEFPVADIADFVSGNYVYDPNAGLHKLCSPFAIYSRYPELKRAGQNTDLYVSSHLYKDFPGRIFKMEGLPDKRELKAIRNEPYDIICRNYPRTADQLRSKLRTRSSESRYLIAMRATKDGQPIILKAERLN